MKTEMKFGTSRSARRAAKALTSRGALGALLMMVAAGSAEGQWSRSYEQYYLPGSFNWQFRHNYPAGDRLFNAFDYGHAILYEKLWTRPGAPVSLLEEKEYNFITRELLVHPPNLPLEEAAIEIEYAKLAPEAKQMFDWAHLLHRQIYDVWADERISVAKKDVEVEKLVRYYKTRKDLAFSSIPKTMELMEGQPYSLSFRKNYPKFNGLIWGYHWLQIGLYEPLIAGKNKDERQTGVLATVARFRQMIENPPSNMPRMMPMSPAVAPLFTARYPEAAIIFDNLHSMHDVVSDILSNPSVPRDRKRTEIMRAASRYRDNTSFTMTRDEWKGMSHAMGIENMGGPVMGVLAGFPQPTVERGAVVSHAQMPGMSGMAGMSHTAPQPTARGGKAPMAGMDHSKMTQPSGTTQPMAGMDHSKMTQPRAGTIQPMAGMDHSKMTQPMAGMDMTSMRGGDSKHMMAMHMKMMADPVIRSRMMADPEMRRMMQEMG
ncbi:MAG TPA: hypothetical protein VNJ04_11490, partial [Gemmatimonadaceae bacterium]|nr:hypothetical protein [Gemmatimonadaceae bacterium]